MIRLSFTSDWADRNTYRFRWVQCQLNELKLLERDSARLDALKNLAPDLPRSYKKILDRLSERLDDQTLMLRALTWLLYCSYPLKLEYLATAACIDPLQPFSEDQRVDDNNTILKKCRSLICVQAETNFVELCHFSITQFLKSETMPDGSKNLYYLPPDEGNAHLMKACFMYLRSPTFVEPLLSTLRTEEMSAQFISKLRDRLGFYAIFGWEGHAKAIKDKDRISEDVYNFLKGEGLGTWSELWELEELGRHRWWEDSPNDISNHPGRSRTLLCELHSASPGRFVAGGPLYYASLSGFETVVARLLKDSSEDPNTLGGRRHSPLLAAFSNGHMGVVNILRKAGANVNMCKDGSTALHDAVDKGNLTLVKLLVNELKANLEVHNARGLPALHVGVQKLATMQPDENCEELVKVLAIHGSDVRDVNGRTALHWAVSLNSHKAAALLIENGADLDAADKSGRIPLHLSEIDTEASLLEMLLRETRNPHVSDKLGFTPLHLAVKQGNRHLTQVLLRRNLDAPNSAEVYTMK